MLARLVLVPRSRTSRATVFACASRTRTCFCSRTSHAHVLNARALALRTPQLVRHHIWIHIYWIMLIYILYIDIKYLCPTNMARGIYGKKLKGFLVWRKKNRADARRIRVRFLRPVRPVRELILYISGSIWFSFLPNCWFLGGFRFARFGSWFAVRFAILPMFKNKLN